MKVLSHTPTVTDYDADCSHKERSTLQSTFTDNDSLCRLHDIERPWFIPKPCCATICQAEVATFESELCDRTDLHPEQKAAGSLLLRSCLHQAG